MTPPKAVPCGFAWCGIIKYRVSTVLSLGLLPFSFAIVFSTS
jgi:hypothetical protein